MKFVYALVLISSALSVEGSTALRGNLGAEQEVGGPFDLLKCLFEGSLDEEKCAESVNKQGEPCSFCFEEDENGNTSGICVDPSLAPNMEQRNPQISCDKTTSLALAVASVEDYHDFKCSIKGFNDPDKCSHMHTDDGKKKCEYCSMDGPFGEKGICVSPEHAKQLKHMAPTMKCSSGEQEVESFDLLKCLFEGSFDEEKCAESVNKQGEPCSFCVEDDGSGNKAGICVDPSLAPNMEQMNPQVSCDKTTSLAVASVEDYHDFKCSIKGFNDPDKCSHMHTDDGKKHCKFCSVEGPIGKTGFCVSPEHAKELIHMAPTMKCSSGEDSEEAAKAESSPVTDCNLSGVDMDTCLDPDKVNGSECIWCDAGIGGFCFPKSWADNAGHFLECKEKQAGDVVPFEHAGDVEVY